MAVNPVTATPETTRVVVSNYTLMAITIIVLGTRAFLSLKWKRKLGLDDLLLGLALAAGITESALVEHAVRRGLGTYIRPGNSSRLKKISELVYASDLFFLIAIFLSKLAVVRLAYRIGSASAVSKGRLFILQVLVLGWAAFSIPAIAFQCGNGTLPWLYAPERCVGSGALWYPTLILSILTDVWLAVCVWSIVPDMAISAKQRQITLGLFSTRFVACLLCIIQLGFLAPALKNINQPTAMPNPTVLKQFVMNASLLSAALPVLYRAVATYAPSSSATATIYNPDIERQQTPLKDMKSSASTVLPNPKKFDGVVSETEAKSPSVEQPDFASKLSLAFNKEIEAASK